MKWNFWRRDKTLKRLEPHMLAFIMVKSVIERDFPFNKWRGEGKAIPERAAAFVEMAVNLYQLCIFLDFLERKFGSDVSGIVRSHIVALMSKGEFVGLVSDFFKAVQIGRASTEREAFFDGKPSYQVDCNVAKAILQISSEPEDEKTALYPLLGQSLTLGRISAEAAFSDLIEEIEFRPETIAGLDGPEHISLAWSEACGCFERQLQRRHNNPLFPPEKRRIITAELIEAQSQDLCDLLKLRKDSKNFVDDFTSTLAQKTTFGEMSKKREVVQELIVRASGIGDLAKTEQKACRSAFKVIVNSMLAACPEEYKAEFQSLVAELDGYLYTFANPFVAQVNRKDTPIKKDELIASLLVEDVETVRIMVKLLPKDSRVGLAEEASMLIEHARKEGHTVLQATEKLKAFEENAPDLKDKSPATV